MRLNLKTKYFNKNLLILGEGLHTIHPIAGQGFNLVLRDIKKLQEILKYYSQLGISFKNSFALDDFYAQRKAENIFFGLGVDATHAFFKQNKYLDPFKEIILKNISKNLKIKIFILFTLFLRTRQIKKRYLLLHFMVIKNFALL